MDVTIYSTDSTLTKSTCTPAVAATLCKYESATKSEAFSSVIVISIVRDVGIAGVVKIPTIMSVAFVLLVVVVVVVVFAALLVVAVVFAAVLVVVVAFGALVVVVVVFAVLALDVVWGGSMLLLEEPQRVQSALQEPS